MEEETPPELSSHDRILVAARALFSSQGYEHATTSAIARTAGTSESQLIKHFGSKEGLLEAIFEQAWQRISRGLIPALAQAKTPFDKLRTLADVLIDSFEEDKDLQVLMLLEGRRIRKHGHTVVLTRGFLQLIGFLDGILQEMREAGQMRSDLHIEAIRSILIGSFEGLLRDQLLAERGNFPAHYSSQELRAAYHMLLQCLSGKGKAGGKEPAGRK
jgi:AcrR family transcriptional regulator